MEYEYSKKFLKDLKRFSANKELIEVVAKKAQHISKAKNADDFSEMIAIRKTTSHYRIKIKLKNKTTFRLGIQILKNTVWFACLENDKKRFYKRFPR